jgi:hypothetical protein
MERVIRFSIDWDPSESEPWEGLKLFRATLIGDPRVMLDVTDYLLSKTTPGTNTTDARRLQELDRLLMEAGSMYRVDMEGEPPRLIRRVEGSVEEAARVTMSREDTAGNLLRRAWNSVYGRHPNPSDGYRQAVRAVEAAAIPIVLPNDASATLGKVIGNLRSHPDLWHLSFTHRTEPHRPIQTLVSMLTLLWEGQYDRHVGEGVPLLVSQEEAETALHLSVTLVQWFIAGQVSRRPYLQPKAVGPPPAR